MGQCMLPVRGDDRNLIRFQSREKSQNVLTKLKKKRFYSVLTPTFLKSEKKNSNTP